MVQSPSILGDVTVIEQKGALMEPDRMSVRLHLRRIRVVAVLVDLVERLVVEIVDVHRVVRCPHRGFKTTRIHDTRRLRIRDLPTQGRPTELKWLRRRFSCGVCGERHWESHPEMILGRRTHVTRRLARQLVRDVNPMSIREMARRSQGHRWMKGVKVVVSDGSTAYRNAIRTHLGHATHVLDRFHVARWFAGGMIEGRRRIQRVGPYGTRPVFEPEIFHSRYLQLTRFDQLPDHRVEALGRILQGRPELEAAWRML